MTNILCSLRTTSSQEAQGNLQSCSCDPPSFPTAGPQPWLRRTGTPKAFCAATAASRSSHAPAQTKQGALKSKAT